MLLRKITITITITLIFIAAQCGAASPAVLERLLSNETYEYLKGGYRSSDYANSPEYRNHWTFLRYPIRQRDLGENKLVVLDNIRLRCSTDRNDPKVRWGALAMNPNVVKDVYLIFNSFDLGSDEEYADMEEQASSKLLSPELLALLNKIAPLYLRTRMQEDAQDEAAMRRELVRMMVGHAQLYFEFHPDWCVIGDGQGEVRATPGFVISLDARGRRSQKYDPFAGMYEHTYDAMYNIVDIRDALRWSTTSDTGTTFFRMKMSQLQKRRLLDRMIGVACNELPLKRFPSGEEVLIRDYRYQTLNQACINTSLRLLNEQFDEDKRLPVIFNPCDFMAPAERQENDLCTLFDEMSLPSAETSVFGVVGNALVGRDLAERCNGYPANIQRMIEEADDIDVRPSYPTYNIVAPPAENGPMMNDLFRSGSD